MYFFIIKPTRCTNFSNLFWHETLHVSDSSSVHHQEFVHCTLSNGICHTGLHILLYHIAALVLYSFSLVFLYWYVSFACLALTDFTFMWPCIVTIFCVIRSTRCTNFTNLFCHETLHVLDSASVHHQEFIHCTLSTGISWSFSKAVYKPVWHIPVLSVQWMNSWWWTEALSKKCRVSWQNKFVKLVHLVGFIIKKLVLSVSLLAWRGSLRNRCCMSL